MFTSSNPINDGPANFFLPYLMTSTFGGASAAPANGAAAANTAYFLPFNSPRNGGLASVAVNCAATTGNLDLGIYAADGTRLGSSGAFATTLGNMTWTPTNPVPLVGGVQYWIAMSASSGTSQWNRVGGTAIYNYGIGMLIQASAHPLPSTATFANGSAATFMPIFALTLV